MSHSLCRSLAKNVASERLLVKDLTGTCHLKSLLRRTVCFLLRHVFILLVIFSCIVHYGEPIVNCGRTLSKVRHSRRKVRFYSTFRRKTRLFDDRLFRNRLANQETSCYALVVAHRAIPVYWGEFT